MGRPMPLHKIQMIMLIHLPWLDIVDLQDIVGCTFRMDKHADGQHFCACSIG